MFRVGDTIRGLPGNGYSLTGDAMTRAVVTRCDPDNIMWVLIVEHQNRAVIGSSYPVFNSEKLFERI